MNEQINMGTLAPEMAPTKARPKKRTQWSTDISPELKAEYKDICSYLDVTQEEIMGIAMQALQDSLFGEKHPHSKSHLKVVARYMRGIYSEVQAMAEDADNARELAKVNVNELLQDKDHQIRKLLAETDELRDQMTAAQVEVKRALEAQQLAEGKLEAAEMTTSLVPGLQEQLLIAQKRADDNEEAAKESMALRAELQAVKESHMADEIEHQKQLRELMEKNFELELKLAKQ